MLFARSLPRQLKRGEFEELGIVLETAEERQTDKSQPDEIKALFSTQTNVCGAFFEKYRWQPGRDHRPGGTRSQPRTLSAYGQCIKASMHNAVDAQRPQMASYI